MGNWKDLVIETAALAKSIGEIGSRSSLLPDDWKRISVDCPSTGGSGNKLPVIVPPIVIATAEILGLNTDEQKNILIPKMSTKGIPGGTIDILESVGYNAEIPLESYKRIVNACGYSNIQPLKELAPLDNLLMNLRRQTGIKRHPELVVASILGKKWATKCRKLVIEVKTGVESKMRFHSGDPIKDVEYGARLFLDVGKELKTNTKGEDSGAGDSGIEIVCLLTDGNHPQGKFIGNKLALLEAVAILQGVETVSFDIEVKGATESKKIDIGSRLKELAIQTTLEMLKLADSALPNDAESKIDSVLKRKGSNNSKALTCFAKEMKAHGVDGIENLGGEIEKRIGEVISKGRHIKADKTGVIKGIDVLETDHCAKLLITRNDKIADYEAGIILHKQVGEVIEEGEILATVCSGSNSQHVARAMEILQNAFKIETGRSALELSENTSDLMSRFSYRNESDLVVEEWTGKGWKVRKSSENRG